MIIQTVSGPAVSLMEAIGFAGRSPRVICAVGGGGKSSFLRVLGEELAGCGLRVIQTTTTHIRRPASRVLTEPEPRAIRSALDAFGQVTVGLVARERKLTGDRALVRALIPLADVLLVEADGSKNLPLKAPADHEPVVPEEADLVVGAAGVGALGSPLGACCHRPELAADILGCGLDQPVTEAHMATLLSDVRGQRKAVPRAYCAMLGQWDLNPGGGARVLAALADRGIAGFGVSFRL